MIREFATRADAPTRSTDAGKKLSRALLACGAIAGPIFIAGVAIQAATRPGFDITRHPPSLLSLGDLGWIQIANFVVTGVLFIASGIGMRRVLRPMATWGPLLIGLVGVSMIVGGIFLADPGLGFPAGAPAGQPTGMSWHAMVHFSGFAVGFLSLVSACLVFASRFGRKRSGWAAYCATTAALVAAAFVLVMSGLSGGNLVPLYVAVVLGWVWASAIAAQLMGEAA